ncbi:ATP-binding cassette sub-family A member 17-like [Planococcus citri]|uniref:ATP-binding cassette sub-family A member 17-like n=1 Tax=Planococcus citri TaxID=170843 RepID=UPI0031F93E77
MRRNVQVPAQQEATAEIIYEVPISEASKFVNLFRNLENDDLKISEINVTSNSIEHALMKLRNSSTNHSFKSPNTLEILVSGHDSSHHVPANDFLMKLRQIKILFQKRVHYVMRDRKNILCRIILPTFIALLFLVIVEHLNVDPFVPMKMSPSTYINPSIMLSPISWSHQMNEFVANYMNSEHVSFLVSAENSKMIENLVDFGRKDVMRFRRELIAAFEFGANKSHHIWYNLWVLHSLPIAITTYSNILLRHITKDESLEIITFNHPIAVANIECRTNELWSHVFIVLMILFIMFGYFTIEIVLYLFELSSKEIANGLMHLQIMSGVPPWIYWFATIVFDLLFFIIVVVVRIALFTLLDNYHKFFTYDFNFGVFSLLVFIFGTTGLMYAYIISFLYKPTNRTYAHLFEFNFLCHLIVAMSYLLFPSPGDIEETQRRYSLLTYVFMWFPFLNFPWAVARYLKQWLKNNECSLTCSSRLKSWCGTVHTASKSALEFSTYENPNGILLELTFLAISLIISAVIFILMNFGFVDLVHNYFKSKEPPYRNYDEDVKHERIEIHHIKEESRHFQIPLLVDGLSKNYIKRLKPITCVEDVSFMANHGTCFGILRGYEAGKTTVFDMMTAKTIPTRGNVSVEGVEMRTNKREYFSKIGYCPRMSPVLDKFTGKEMLLLIASLNGSRSDPENLVSEWISASGLDELQHVKCEDYTDGSKRLLSTVLALLGHPKVVFLDEPTSEIDSQTRRHLYDIIEQVKYSHRTVVFGSTSAIECYLLCDRLTILKNGAMHCLGHPHDLRKHYDLGFFIVIKVQSDIMSMREVRYLEDHMIRVFGSKAAHLIEHYRGLLHYQIADTKLRVSVIFKRMEEIKESNSIIEEYFVRTTTLEDIFDFFSH